MAQRIGNVSRRRVARPVGVDDAFPGVLEADRSVRGNRVLVVVQARGRPGEHEVRTRAALDRHLLLGRRRRVDAVRPACTSRSRPPRCGSQLSSAKRALGEEQRKHGRRRDENCDSRAPQRSGRVARRATMVADARFSSLSSRPLVVAAPARPARQHEAADERHPAHRRRECRGAPRGARARDRPRRRLDGGRDAQEARSLTCGRPSDGPGRHRDGLGGLADVSPSEQRAVRFAGGVRLRQRERGGPVLAARVGQAALACLAKSVAGGLDQGRQVQVLHASNRCPAPTTGVPARSRTASSAGPHSKRRRERRIVDVVLCGRGDDDDRDQLLGLPGAASTRALELSVDRAVTSRLEDLAWGTLGLASHAISRDASTLPACADCSLVAFAVVGALHFASPAMADNWLPHPVGRHLVVRVERQRLQPDADDRERHGEEPERRELRARLDDGRSEQSRPPAARSRSRTPTPG